MLVLLKRDFAIFEKLLNPLGAHLQLLLEGDHLGFQLDDLLPVFRPQLQLGSRFTELLLQRRHDGLLLTSQLQFRFKLVQPMALL